MATSTDAPWQPLLTLAVPTYNRSRFLATFLAAAVPQVAGEPRVELLISDNASHDNTGELVASYQREGTPIRYFCNRTNLGADLNILQCFELATGKYVWICGDDDVIEPSGLRRVLVHLESDPEYDLISLQARGFHGDYFPQVPGMPEKVSVFTRAEDLAAHVHVFFSFITGTIINKNRVAELPHRPFSDLASTNLVQLSWTYTAVEHHRRSLLIHTPLVATLAHNTGGYALFTVFGTNLKRITDQWITSEKVRNAIYRGALLAFFPWFLVRSKGGPQFTAENPETILRPLFGGYRYYWLFNYPIIRLSPLLGRIWFLFVKAVNRADKILGRPLLRLPG